MYCLKCGKETAEGQVFCKHCLEIMEDYPVKANTHIQLPKRISAPISKKQSRRRSATPEDQISYLRVVVRTLIALLGTVSVVLGIFIGLYFNRDDNGIVDELPIGQNYTVDSTES